MNDYPDTPFNKHLSDIDFESSDSSNTPPRHSTATNDNDGDITDNSSDMDDGTTDSVGDMSATSNDSGEALSVQSPPNELSVEAVDTTTKRGTRLFQNKRTPEHRLTTADVERMFREAGFPKSRRTIERYCVPGKLDAFYDRSASQYWITESSISQMIEFFRKDAGFDNTPTNTPPRHSTATNDNDGDITDNSSDMDDGTTDSVGDMSATSNDSGVVIRKLQSQLKQKEQDFETLEREMRNLQIADQVKDGLLKKNEAQFKTFLEHLQTANQKVGELESENKRLRSLPAGSQRGQSTSPHNADNFHDVEVG